MKKNGQFLKEARASLESATLIIAIDDDVLEYNILRAAGVQAQQAANTLFQLLGIIQAQQSAKENNR